MFLKYKVRTKTGEYREGEAVAEDAFSLAREFRKDGEMPISITEVRTHSSVKFSTQNLFGNILGPGKIKLEEKINFTRNLSGMIMAGLPLGRALSILEKQTKNKRLQSVLHSVIEDVNRGSSLSDGLKKFPKVFSPLFISMIRAGEESGSLSQSLAQVGTNLDKSYTLTRKIKGAMTYPLIIICAMVIIGVLMFMFVVPTLVATFKELGGDLPASTRFIIFISNTISGHPFLLLLTFGGIIGGFVLLSKLKLFQQGFDYVVIRLPVIGMIAKEVNSARTARTISSLLDAGIEITRCLTITKDVLQNSLYKKVIDQAIVSVEKGAPLSEAFKAHPELYPVMVGEMMEVGGETGKLSSMLSDIAIFYETEVDAKTKDLSTIIEPLLMVFIGAGVGFFAYSIISPLYSIGSSIQ